MKALPILLFILLTSCEFTENPEYSVSTELEPYITEFYNQAEIRGYNYPRFNLKVYVSDIKNGANGQSRTNLSGQRSIVINRNYFEANKNSVNGRLLITRTVFHEFGHTLFKKDHDTDSMSVMCVESQKAVDCWIRYPERRKLIIDHLFGYKQ